MVKNPADDDDVCTDPVEDDVASLREPAQARSEGVTQDPHSRRLADEIAARIEFVAVILGLVYTPGV
jgi:hypothetical protein